MQRTERKFNLDLEFQNLFLFVRCILFIAKIKYFQGTIDNSSPNTSPNSDFMVLDAWKSVFT